MNWKEHVDVCIFDLDGVIVDTAKYHFTAWRDLAKGIGFEFDEVFNEKLKGVSRAESLKLILAEAKVELSASDFEKALIDKNEHYLELIQSMNKLEILPGVLTYLVKLAKSGVGIALGSASKNAKNILNRVELIDFFDIISDGNMVSKSKPDPEVFLICSSHYGVDPSRCVVFEDSIKGIQAANTGRFKSVGIGEPKVLHEAQVVYTSFEEHDPAELLALYS